MMSRKKRYEHIWENGNWMRVFEYDGYVLCHEYRGKPVNEGRYILLLPIDGGFISNGYPYSYKCISCRDTVRIEKAPRPLPRFTELKQQPCIPATAKKAQETDWEQIKLF